LRHGGFRLLPASRSAFHEDQSIELKQREFELAQCLFAHLGQLLSRDYLMRTVWGRDIDLPSRTLDTHISAIRTKMGLRPQRGLRLSAVYGHGYRLEAVSPEAGSAA
jgi:DNA-binding response OmpR family regulator